MNLDKVIIKKVEEYNLEKVVLAVEEIFKTLSVANSINEKTKVAIKPNLVAKHGPEAAITTHPVVVEAVITALRVRGARDITVIDSAGGVYGEAAMRPIYKISGMEELCKRLDVRCGDDYGSEDRKINGVRCREFTVINPINNADIIINLPKLKTHAMMGFSCAVKNLYGVIPGLKKAELHMRFPDRNFFGEMLCDLCELVKPDITIVDAIIGMEGDGPTGGDPRFIGQLIAGENIYNVDLVSAATIGVETMDIPYLVSAQKRGICGEFSTEILYNAENFKPIKDFKKPSTQKSIIFANRLPKHLRFIMPFVAEHLSPRPVVNKKGCIGCAKCAEICPKDIITITSRKAFINKKNCIRCYCCHEMCPVKAIDIKSLGLFNA